MWTPESAVPASLKAQLESKLEAADDCIITFLEIVSLLKKQRRTGWVDYNIKDCESIADHMYRMAVITTLLPTKVANIMSETKETVVLDKARCTQIAVVHDIAESLVGDITPRDTKVDKHEKHRRELATIEYLAAIVARYDAASATLIKDLWLEYENIVSLEARYVKDIDKFEMMSQAFEYEKEHNVNLEPFYEAAQSVKTAEVQKLTASVLRQRNVWLGGPASA